LSIVPLREKEAWNELLPGPIPKGCGAVNSLCEKKGQKINAGTTRTDATVLKVRH